MTIPAGYRQASIFELDEVLTQESEEQQTRDRAQKAKAQAYAHVSHSLGGVSPRNMTASQRAMAEAIARRWNGEGTTQKGYGFSLDTSGRMVPRPR